MYEHRASFPKESHVDANLVDRRGNGRYLLWFALFGGGGAWLAHLLLAYLIAEFGCTSGGGHARLLGITAIAWTLLAVSLLTFVAASGATLVAYFLRLRLAAAVRDEESARNNEFFLAKTALITSALFSFIILVQSVPIFYYLSDC